jgi:hypothetical protein
MAASTLVLAADVVLPSTAGAAIANVQTGAEKTSTNGSISPTLSSASTAGDLLVAVVGNNDQSTSATFSGPSGWTNATGIWQSGNGRVEVWYDANNAGGITSATFTASSGTNTVVGQLSEWRGAAFTSPVDQTGTITSGGSRSATVSASGTTTLPGDLAITGFNTSAAEASFTAGTGWSNVFSDPANGFVADKQTGIASGTTVSETESAPSRASWVAVVVAFKPGCTGGSLTLNSPTTVAYPSITLNGKDQTATVNGTFTPNDQTNSNAGWNIAGTSTTFTATGGKTLPTTATQITAASAAAASQNCSLPTNSIAYPVTLPAAATAPAATKLYNAAANTGAGPSNVTLTFTLTTPAKTLNGSYTSTWTFTIASGP